MYRHPILRNKAMPTMTDVKRAMTSADADDLLARDVRPLMAILMRLVSANSRLKGHITTRTTAITAFSWSITPDNPDDQEKCDEVRRRLQRVINEICRNHMQAVLYDVLCIRIAWEMVEGAHTPRIVKRYKAVEVEKQDDYTVFLLADTDTCRREARLDINALTDEYIVDVSDDDDRGGLMRSLVLREVLHEDMLREWANYNKKLKGVLHLLYDEDAEPKEKVAAMKALESAVINNYLATTKAIDFNVHEIVKGSATSFKEMIEKLAADTSIGLLGQANTSELPSGGGSRAALQVLNLIRADLHYDDMQRVERVVNEQLLAYDYKRNYNTAGGSPPWKFEINIPEEVSLEARVLAVKDMIEAGVELDTDEVYKMTGFKRPPTFTSDVIKRTASAI